MLRCRRAPCPHAARVQGGPVDLRIQQTSSSPCSRLLPIVPPRSTKFPPKCRAAPSEPRPKCSHIVHGVSGKRLFANRHYRNISSPLALCGIWRHWVCHACKIGAAAPDTVPGAWRRHSSHVFPYPWSGLATTHANDSRAGVHHVAERELCTQRSNARDTNIIRNGSPLAMGH